DLSAFSRAESRSASLSVTPNHLVRNTMESLPRDAGSRPHPNPAMNLIAVMLGKKQYAAAFVLTKLENPVILIGDVPCACGITKMLSAGSCVPIIGSFDLGCSLTAPANSLSFTQ